MSRTFEILQRAQQDRDLFRVPPVTRAVPANAAVTGSESPLHDLASFTREEVLRLVQRLFLAADNVGNTALRQVVFCGIDETDGSNRLCARVGRILAQQTQSQVCVVDANVRAPSSSSLLDLLPFDDSPGLEGGSTHGPSRRVTDNLWLASGGSACRNGPSPTLDDVQTWISSLPAQFAHVIISAPPIGLYADAALLGQTADGVVLVLEANSTRSQTARRAKKALEGANVRVLGTVLNNRTFPIPEKIYRLL
jgi:Mrp family chromosome partitioning ATPase